MLPPRPSLEQIRKRAKELRDLVRTGHAKFTAMATTYHPAPPASWTAFTLADAQLVLARLDHGADPNAGYLPDGQPPPVTVLSACFRGRLDPASQAPHPRSFALARLLLDRGADVNDERAVENACGYPHDDAAPALLLRSGFGRERAAGSGQAAGGIGFPAQ